MNRRVYFAFLGVFFTQTTYAIDWEVNSIRLTLSKPQTFHSLTYNPSSEAKINFELEPINNERVGLFVDLNGIELGYAIDFIDDDIQTKTQDFIFSYKDLKHSRITLNYQTLEGFDTQALNLLNEQQRESRFKESTESTKIELFGLHDVYTFFGESLFDHFFLNRPQLSQSNKVGLSLIAAWSYKNLTLETDQNLIFSPDYLNSNVDVIQEIGAESFDVTLGPLLSVSLRNNVHLFGELKAGKGYFRNKDEDTQLKRSGNETIYSIGGGASWTSSNKKHLFLLRAWLRQGRHVETTFGDLSYIRFF